jgi:hypothetical protein
LVARLLPPISLHCGSHPTQPLSTLCVRRRRRLTQHSLPGGSLGITWAGSWLEAAAIPAIDDPIALGIRSIARPLGSSAQIRPKPQGGRPESGEREASKRRAGQGVT